VNRRTEARPSKRSRRLHVPALGRDAEEVSLSAEQTHYVRTVLRLSRGDELTLFDGTGLEYPAVVSESSPRGVRLAVSPPRAGLREPPVPVILGVGLLKAQKMDLVVQKTVELGVQTIVPLASDRSVRTLDKERGSEKRARWEKIAREASRQCGRCRVPEVRPVATLDEVLAGVCAGDLRLLFTMPAAASLETIRGDGPGRPERILALTGPEGGFSPEEASRSLEAGFLPVNLGPRTLRAETAAILAVGLIQYRFGDLGGPASSREPRSPCPGQID